MVSLREKAVKRIVLSVTFLFCQDSLETLRTEQRKFAGKLEKSELSLEKSRQIIGGSELPPENSR